MLITSIVLVTRWIISASAPTSVTTTNNEMNVTSAINEKPLQCPLLNGFTPRTESADSGDSARSAETAVSPTTVWASPVKSTGPHIASVPLIHFNSAGKTVTGVRGSAVHLAGFADRLSDLAPDELAPALSLFLEVLYFIAATIAVFAFGIVRGTVGYSGQLMARLVQRSKRIVSFAFQVATRLMLSTLRVVVVGWGRVY